MATAGAQAKPGEREASVVPGATKPTSSPEHRAAPAAACRNHTLDANGLEAALQIWEEFWSATRPVELRPEVERHAGELAQRHSLRGADAVHLASALTVPTTELIVAVWDLRLHAGARAEGLATTPASL